MKRRRTGEKHPRKISGSAKTTELRQARRFRPAGFSVAAGPSRDGGAGPALILISASCGDHLGNVGTPFG
jgi:hypothetical protein